MSSAYSPKLIIYRELIRVVYLEMVRVFPREQKGFITQNQGLLVNAGIWIGWLLSLGLSYLQIDPSTWQAAQGLHHWAKKREKDPRQHSPLTLARSLWPGAPLEYQADDGKAVALLLSLTAFRDHHKGIDRASLQEINATKKQSKKQADRKAKKASKFLTF